MKNFWIGVLLIAALTATSCKKNDKELIIKGVITSAHSGQPVGGANIKLSKNGLSSGAFNPTYNFVTSVESDGSGNYSLAFSGESPGEFKVETSKDGFLKETSFLSTEEVNVSQPFTLNQALSPSGLLHISLKNIQPGAEEDFLSFQLSEYSPICSCCPIGLMEFNGPVIDYESTCTLPANKWQRYVYFYMKDGNSSTSLDSVWVTPGQTNELLIEF